MKDSLEVVEFTQEEMKLFIKIQNILKDHNDKNYINELKLYINNHQGVVDYIQVSNDTILCIKKSGLINIIYNERKYDRKRLKMAKDTPNKKSKNVKRLDNNKCDEIVNKGVATEGNYENEERKEENEIEDAIFDKEKFATEGNDEIEDEVQNIEIDATEGSEENETDEIEEIEDEKLIDIDEKNETDEIEDDVLNIEIDATEGSEENETDEIEDGIFNMEKLGTEVRGNKENVEKQDDEIEGEIDNSNSREENEENVTYEFEDEVLNMEIDDDTERNEENETDEIEGGIFNMEKLGTEVRGNKENVEKQDDEIEGEIDNSNSREENEENVTYEFEDEVLNMEIDDDTERNEENETDEIEDGIFNMEKLVTEVRGNEENVEKQDDEIEGEIDNSKSREENEENVTYEIEDGIFNMEKLVTEVRGNEENLESEIDNSKSREENEENVTYEIEDGLLYMEKLASEGRGREENKEKVDEIENEILNMEIDVTGGENVIYGETHVSLNNEFLDNVESLYSVDPLNIESLNFGSLNIESLNNVSSQSHDEIFDYNLNQQIFNQASIQQFYLNYYNQHIGYQNFNLFSGIQQTVNQQTDRFSLSSTSLDNNTTSNLQLSKVSDLEMITIKKEILSLEKVNNLNCESLQYKKDDNLLNVLENCLIGDLKFAMHNCSILKRYFKAGALLDIIYNRVYQLDENLTQKNLVTGVIKGVGIAEMYKRYDGSFGYNESKRARELFYKSTRVYRVYKCFPSPFSQMDRAMSITANQLYKFAGNEEFEEFVKGIEMEVCSNYDKFKCGDNDNQVAIDDSFITNDIIENVLYFANHPNEEMCN